MATPTFTGCGMAFTIIDTPDPDLFRVSVSDQQSGDPITTVLVIRENGAAKATGEY